MIEVSGLYKSYGRKEVLRGIDLRIDPGTITAVLGPNGSGKTTLIKSILGIVRSQKGIIRVNGVEINGNCSYKNDIGYLPQIARFPENLKVRELIHMVSDLRNKKGDEIILAEMFGLKPFFEVRLNSLSGGTRQKVNILMAFMFDTKQYILDEPTAGLDPLSLIHFKELIRDEKEKGKSVLLTTHIINLVDEIADQVIFLLDGKVFFNGPLRELKALNGDADLETAIANILKKTQNV